MSTIKAVIKSPLEHDQHEGIPSQATFFFPPFPPVPPRRSLQSLNYWRQAGVYLAPDLATSSTGQDVRGLRLVPDKGTGDARSIQVAEERAKEKKLRQLQKGKLGVRVVREDCWKIGEEDTDWIEPEGTSKSDYDA